VAGLQSLELVLRQNQTKTGGLAGFQVGESTGLGRGHAHVTFLANLLTHELMSFLRNFFNKKDALSSYLSCASVKTHPSQRGVTGH
jgi:Na+-transporting NADH:ubiquinone oxidoreductase subunit NqrA